MDDKSDTEVNAAVKKESPVSLPSCVLARMSPFARWGLVLAASTLLISGGYYAWHAVFGEDESSASFLTAVAQRGNLEDTVTATGTLQPKDFVDVGTQVSGEASRWLGGEALIRVFKHE